MSYCVKLAGVGGVVANETRIEYQEFPLDKIMRYFSKDFKVPRTEYVNEQFIEWFIDTSKGKVVFKLFVQEKTYPEEVKGPSRNATPDTSIKPLEPAHVTESFEGPRSKKE